MQKRPDYQLLPHQYVAIVVVGNAGHPNQLPLAEKWLLGPCLPRRWRRIAWLNDALAAIAAGEAQHLVTNATTVASWKRTATATAIITTAEVDAVITCASAAPSASTIAASTAAVAVVGLQRASYAALGTTVDRHRCLDGVRSTRQPYIDCID